MIIWLASYPKSGNTWVRGFLVSLLYSKDGSAKLQDFQKINQYPLRSNFKNLLNDLDDIHKLKQYWSISQDIMNLDKKIKFLKTHNSLCTLKDCTFTNSKNTLGVIYIVRDPRNVITSIKYHYSKKNYLAAKEFIFDENRVLGTNTNNKRIINLKDNEIITPISSWKTHYISWRQVKKNFLLIKYENLINNPKKEFIKITNYLSKILNLTFSDKKIDNCISSNSFEKLKQQEKMFGFSESISDKITGARKNFFNLGPNNNWQKLLDKKIVNEIEKKFENEMRELGYI